jgi:hypothetical protein
MAEKKWANNILTSDKPNVTFPAYRPKMDPEFVRRIVHLDADTVPGAEFYSEAMWIVPGAKTDMIEFKSHTHTWGEFIGFFGFNYDDIQDLGGEIEFTVDNKKYNITKSFAAYVPPGIQHGPLVIKNVRIPIMHFTAGPTERYE